jgi:hypothetical protein
MAYYVRTEHEGGYLWLARGKLVSAALAAPYMHPSAAFTAADNMNEKMRKKGLAEYNFDILPSKTGVPIKLNHPFVYNEPEEKRNLVEILAVQNNEFARVLLIHGRYEVLVRVATFNTAAEAMEAAGTLPAREFSIEGQ